MVRVEEKKGEINEKAGDLKKKSGANTLKTE
jgi:hypothetical protein